MYRLLSCFGVILYLEELASLVAFIELSRFSVIEDNEFIWLNYARLRELVESPTNLERQLILNHELINRAILIYIYDLELGGRASNETGDNFWIITTRENVCFIYRSASRLPLLMTLIGDGSHLLHFLDGVIL